MVDPCVGQGVALNLLTHGADVRRYGVELDAERALAASSIGIETIQGNTFDAVAKPESFSLLYLSVEEVRDLLVPSYPELATATLTGPEDTGTTLRYTFNRAIGSKG